MSVSVTLSAKPRPPVPSVWVGWENILRILLSTRYYWSVGEPESNSAEVVPVDRPL
jgi:hypothetical protein